MYDKYVYLNDDTAFVVNDNGSASIKYDTSEKLLIIDNKLETAVKNIEQLDDEISDNKKLISFLKKFITCQGVIMGFGVAAAAIATGVTGTIPYLTALIPALGVPTGYLGIKLKSSKSKMIQLYEKKDIASGLLREYQDEWAKEKSSILSKKKENQEIDFHNFEYTSLETKNKQIVDHIEEQIEKPFVKKLVRERKQKKDNK